MNLRIFDTVDDLVRASARTIVQRVGDGARAIALSGGSTPKPLYALLGKPPFRDQLADVPITWVVVDERYVPWDDAQSNAGMIAKTLFAEGMPPAHRFLPFRTDLNSPAATAVRFEEEWRALGLADVDIVLLGIGEEGHTASLFPDSPALDVEDRIAVEVFVPKVDMWRVTITKPVIRAAKLRLVLAAGAKKRPVLEAVRSGVDLPITRVTADVETWWMVDAEAAPSPL